MQNVNFRTSAEDVLGAEIMERLVSSALDSFIGIVCMKGANLTRAIDSARIVQSDA